MGMRTITPRECAHRFRSSRRTVAFSGAGISTAAGIPDFRGPGGLYSSGRYDAQRIFDIDCFGADPREFFRFTRDLAAMLQDLRPTFTHRLLARLERESLLEAVITQNIDPLHQQAGSRRVICLHGNYHSSRCRQCGRSFDYAALLERLGRMDVPRCDCPARGVIKPDVVFFGEPVLGLEEAMNLARGCELMLVLGSSLTVYPAALVPQAAAGDVVVVNRGPVSMEAAPNHYFVQQGLDEFFTDVAGQLGLA